MIIISPVFYNFADKQPVKAQGLAFEMPPFLGCVSLFALVWSAAAQMPSPFKRQLKAQSPPLLGDDVFILQNLLAHAYPTLINSRYDDQTAQNIKAFQSSKLQSRC
jgi:hypothetical protein